MWALFCRSGNCLGVHDLAQCYTITKGVKSISLISNSAFLKICLFLIEGYLLYNIGLVSAIHQCESAVGYTYAPSFLNLPPIFHPIPPLWVVTEHQTWAPYIIQKIPTVGGNVNWYRHYGEQYGNSLKNLRIKLPYDPAIPPLDIYFEETITEKDTCSPLFIAALFTITQI